MIWLLTIVRFPLTAEYLHICKHGSEGRIFRGTGINAKTDISVPIPQVLLSIGMPSCPSWFLLYFEINAGRVTVNLLPLIPSLSAIILPPEASIMLFTIDRPRPEPPISRERDLSTR